MRDMKDVPPAVIARWTPAVYARAAGVIRGRNVPYSVEYEDLITYGFVGVCDAYLTWPGEEAAGCGEATFYNHRIKFAMMDGIRTDSFTGRRLATTTDRDWDTRQRISAPLSINVSRSEINRRGTRAQDEDYIRTPLYAAVELQTAIYDTRAEDDDFIASLLSKLRGKDRYIVLWRLELVPMRRIGSMLGLSESRISQQLKIIATKLAERYDCKPERVMRALNGDKQTHKPYRPRKSRAKLLVT